MSPLQKLLTAVLAGLVLAVGVVLASVAYVRSGGDSQLSLTGGAGATSTIPTLEDNPPPEEKDLVVETTTTSTTTTTTTTVPGLTPSSPPTTRFAEFVSGSGAVLLPPGTPVTRQLAAGSGCQGLAEQGASDVRCEQFRGKGRELIWLTQSTSASAGVLGGGRGRSAQVFQRSGPTQWTLVLERLDSSGSEYRSVNVRVVDVSGDGGQDAVFGFRSASSGDLAVDVVEGSGTVEAHRDAANGAVRVSTGQLDIWSASGATSTHEVIRIVDGRYRVVSSEQVPISQVPPSQL